jgi:hypothetical protein
MRLPAFERPQRRGNRYLGTAGLYRLAADYPEGGESRITPLN